MNVSTASGPQALCRCHHTPLFQPSRNRHTWSPVPEMGQVETRWFKTPLAVEDIEEMLMLNY